MTDHPLRSVTDRSLGKPLPYQLANLPQASLQARGLAIPRFNGGRFRVAALCGISDRFRSLFPTRREITYVLLTRAPLYSSPEGDFRVRLACLRHAASVDSEPGSNSRYKFVLWNIIYYWFFRSVSIMTLASFRRELYRSAFDSQSH